MREIQARIDVIRAGAVYCELAFTNPPRLDASADAEIYLSMAGTFRWRSDVNWLTDELQPVIRIDGEEHPLGVLQIATMRDVFTPEGAHQISLTCYDRALRLKQTKAEQMLFLPAGTAYTTAIRQLLAGAGIALAVIAETAAVLPTAREWEIGTDYLAIVNDLLAEINYEPIWFDADGAAVAQPYADPDPATIQRRYAPGEFSILRPGAEAELDAFAAPNVFIAICSNPDLPAPLVARAVNDNPLSALSVLRRGRRITTVTRVDNIADQAALDAYVQRLASDSMLRSRTVRISTGVEAAHSRHAVIALTHPDLGGIYRETGWSMTLAPGAEMTHELQRLIIV